jgi:L-ascorbate metabolism protein UlaG (beta-lactamase superfamily)
MKITKYGHSCLLVEEKSARLLIDPGGFSSGFEAITGITAVLYTHQHGDHFDPAKLKVIADNNPLVQILADEGTAAQIGLDTAGLSIARHGESTELGGVTVEVIGHEHAVIHPSIPGTPNVGYLVAGRLFHPGDAFTPIGRELEILALPLVAPWSKISETADYLLEINPRIAFPIHDAVASIPQMYMQMVGGIVKDRDIDLRSLEAGQNLEA